MKKLLSFLILTVIFISCSEQDLKDVFSDSLLYKNSSEVMIVSSIEENHSINISDEWSATSSDDWIILENFKGSNNSQLNFTTMPNRSKNKRKGTISLYFKGIGRKDLIIEQEIVTFKLSQDTIICGSLPSYQIFDLETEGDWKIESKSEWINILEDRGFGNSQISFEIEELFSAKERSGKIIISDQSSNHYEVIIIQKGKFLNLDLFELSFLASGTNIEKINYQTDNEDKIEFWGDSWILGGDNDNNSLNVSVTKNNSGNPRKGILYIKLKNIHDFDPIEISIYQAPILINTEGIDLGLSVKWSSFNLGATNEQEVGYYYYLHQCPECAFGWISYPYLICDNPYVDSASAYWGGNWRTPTIEEWEELCQNCTCEEYDDLDNIKYIDVNNEKTGRLEQIPIYKYRKYTSMINGNYIILPLMGYYLLTDDLTFLYGDRQDYIMHYSWTYRISPEGRVDIYNSGISAVVPGNNEREICFAPVRPVWSN